MTSAYCLLPAYFCDKLVYVRYFERHMQIGGRCVCALINYQWCGELCFADATISEDYCPPQSARRGRRKSLWT